MHEVARIGIIANPASGKDIRRLVAAGLITSNHEKANIVHRILAAAAADSEIAALVMPDRSGLARRIQSDLARNEAVAVELVPMEYVSGTAQDSYECSAAMREAGADVIVTLGGDGTNRIVSKAVGQVPILPISTGTNNVFPSQTEGTLAGLAAKAIASGWVSRTDGCLRHPLLELVCDGEILDTALIDMAVVDGIDTGARAVWEPEGVKRIFLTQAPPMAIGLAAIGSAIDPMEPASGEGLCVTLGHGHRTVRVPFAPGCVAPVDVKDSFRFNESVPLACGEGVVALDGEREHVLDPRRSYQVSYRPDGPWVVDVERTLKAASLAGFPEVAKQSSTLTELRDCA